MSGALRGSVCWADLGHGRKPWVVISNNRRNAALGSVIAVRITTTSKNAHLQTVVALTPDDPVVGYVMCDDISPIYADELLGSAGVLSPRTVSAVSDALRVALNL